MNYKVTSLIAGAFLASFAAAGTYTFTPSNNDLGDLDHYYASTWGIDFSVPQGQVITGATLTIKNIYDWTTETNDILYINMLDNPGSGVKTYYDNQGGGNYFQGQGKVVGTWTDPVGGHSTNTNLSFDLGALGLLNSLNQYAADGKFGFGFDADCHYYNDGVKLTVTTAPVPEPASLATLAVGGLALLRRRKKNAA